MICFQGDELITTCVYDTSKKQTIVTVSFLSLKFFSHVTNILCYVDLK